MKNRYLILFPMKTSYSVFGAYQLVSILAEESHRTLQIYMIGSQHIKFKQINNKFNKLVFHHDFQSGKKFNRNEIVQFPLAFVHEEELLLCYENVNNSAKVFHLC